MSINQQDWGLSRSFFMLKQSNFQGVCDTSEKQINTEERKFQDLCCFIPNKPRTRFTRRTSNSYKARETANEPITTTNSLTARLTAILKPLIGEIQEAHPDKHHEHGPAPAVDTPGNP